MTTLDEYYYEMPDLGADISLSDTDVITFVNGKPFRVYRKSGGDYIGVLMQDADDPALVFEDEAENGPDATPVDVVPKTTHVYLDFVGRWRLQKNKWQGFSSSYGHGGSIWSQDNGSGDEPEFSYKQLGPVVQDGDKVCKLKVQGYCNADVGGLNFRFYHHTGPFDTGWAADAQTARTLIFAADDIPVYPNVQVKFDIPLAAEISGDGYIVAHAKPSGNFGGSKYFNTSGYICVERPV